MAVPNALIAVEGVQDAAMLGRLLVAAAYERITDIKDVPEEWQSLISKEYPASKLDGTDEKKQITQPHDVPHYYRNERKELVVIGIAGSDSQLTGWIDAKLAALMFRMARQFKPAAIGILIDQDKAQSAPKRVEELLAGFEKPELAALFPSEPGNIRSGDPRTGVFVMPDNENPGTLETLLLETGEVAYKRQLQQAKDFVANFDTEGLNSKDTEEGRAPHGKNKQHVGVLVAMLKPGKTLATSLQDNRWLKAEALQTPLAIRLRKWLHELLDIPFP